MEQIGYFISRLVSSISLTYLEDFLEYFHEKIFIINFGSLCSVSLGFWLLLPVCLILHNAVRVDFVLRCFPDVWHILKY